MKGLIITCEKFEDSELLKPKEKLHSKGIETIIASFSKGKIKGKGGSLVKVDIEFDDVNPANFDFLLLPGGKAPSRLRKNEKVLTIARHFFKEGKPIAAICHGPQILVSAGLLEGRKATCYSGIAKELKEAGAFYKDKEVVVDRNLITSRIPADLPAFIRELLKCFKKK